MISYEINVVCDGPDEDLGRLGQFGNCEGCWTFEPIGTPDVAAAVRGAVEEGKWKVIGGRHYCEICAKLKEAKTGGAK